MLYYCTAGVRLAACIETRCKESSSGKSQTHQFACNTRTVEAREASPSSLPQRGLCPLDSLQPRASAISRSPSVPPCHHPLSLPTSISPGGPDPRAVCASEPSSAKRTDAAVGRSRSVPVRSTPSSPCWVLGFKGTLEPAGLACCGRRCSGRSGPLIVTLAQGLLILYHLGRPPLVAELSFALDAIPTLAHLCRRKQLLLIHHQQQYHLASSHPHPCCGSSPSTPVSRLTITDLRPSGYSYRSHLHLRLSTAKVRA